ncbi:MAG TPA: trehalose-phosphatase [Actinomycetes bacterium]|nr:trehalose-phosphatase [Actinomycetes bacterium]
MGNSREGRRPPAPGWAELARTPRALFLDIDGTLVEFESHPDLVRATQGLIVLLKGVADALDGALALLSGRSLTDIDRVFSPWQPHAAGVHGAEVRGPGGERRHSPKPEVLEALRSGAAELAESLPGVWVEDKGMSIALHHRKAPGITDELAKEAQRLAEDTGGAFEVQPGILVQELRPADFDKGLALIEIMGEAPFAGRSPIVVGDDRTDEFAFAAAQGLGGLAILVGDRADSHAQLRLADPAAVRSWLAELIEEVRP